MSKTCFKCSRSLPRNQFYRHAQMADGLLGKCKECTKRDARAHRDKNITAVRKYDQERSKQPKRRAHLRRVAANFEARSPTARAAQVKTRRAIRGGRLTKGACEVCGSSAVVAHHDDYLKPLDVRWLCQSHHLKWHVVNGPGKNRDYVPKVA